MVLHRVAGLIAVWALFACPAAAWAPYRDSVWGFSIEPITGWTTTPGNGHDGVWVSFIEPNRLAVCNVAVQPHPDGTAWSQAEIDAQHRGILDPKEFFGELGSTPVSGTSTWTVTVGGNRGVMGEGTAVLPEKGALRIRKLWIEAPLRTYNVNCLSHAESYDRYRPTFEAVMTTFRLD